MKKTIHNIVYYLIFAWAYLHALLPLRLLYVLSDILYVLVYRLVGYRKKVVRENLKNAFGHKTANERLAIEKEFYHHFCDYIVETIKLLHISDAEMQKRMIFKNVDIVKDLLKKGDSGLMYLGHYGNWEWVPSLNLLFGIDITLAQIYRPLKNKAFDKLFLKIRSRFGSIGIPKDNTLRSIISMRKEGKNTLIGFISDQTPSVRNIHYWTHFMNQDTPFFTGVERIAKQTGFHVTFLDVEKVKRGYYTGTVKLITAQPKEEPEFAITEKYVRAIEQSIERNPAYWLWTHQRWKWTHQEVNKRQNT